MVRQDLDGAAQRQFETRRPGVLAQDVGTPGQHGINMTDPLAISKPRRKLSGPTEKLIGHKRHLFAVR